MNLNMIFGFMRDMKMDPKLLTDQIQPMLANLKEPLLDAIKKQEQEQASEIVYLLYSEKTEKGEYTGRVMVSFSRNTETGMDVFFTTTFEELIMMLLTPPEPQEQKQLPAPEAQKQLPQ